MQRNRLPASPEYAYGEAVTRAAYNVCAKLLEDAPYRRHCIESLAIDDNKLLVAGLRRLTKIAKGFAQTGNWKT